MKKMQVYRFVIEGHNGELAGIDVVSSKSPVEALAALAPLLPDGFYPFSVFSWYIVNVPKS